MVVSKGGSSGISILPDSPGAGSCKLTRWTKRVSVILVFVMKKELTIYAVLKVDLFDPFYN